MAERGDVFRAGAGAWLVGTPTPPADEMITEGTPAEFLAVRLAHWASVLEQAHTPLTFPEMRRLSDLLRDASTYARTGVVSWAKVLMDEGTGTGE
jgi:hypothetical protein